TRENLIAENLVLKDDLQTEGAKILTETIRLADPKGEDITKEVKITATETGYQIDTGRNLAFEESFTVTYDVLFEAETLAGKQVVNIARSKADNASAQTENDVTPVEVEEGLAALKSSDPASGTVVKAGQEITYTITLEATGEEDKKNVCVMDAVPEHTQLIPDSILYQVDAADDAPEEDTDCTAQAAESSTAPEDKEDTVGKTDAAGPEENSTEQAEDVPAESTEE
ncbi:MAG: DUF11 domain-containing protein, partial [Eubacterium sp.]|nr:DUF11 domain-containing protein [Eubacterium sp.]